MDSGHFQNKWLRRIPLARDVSIRASRRKRPFFRSVPFFGLFNGGFAWSKRIEKHNKYFGRFFDRPEIVQRRYYIFRWIQMLHVCIRTLSVLDSWDYLMTLLFGNFVTPFIVSGTYNGSWTSLFLCWTFLRSLSYTPWTKFSFNNFIWCFNVFARFGTGCACWSR